MRISWPAPGRPGFTSRTSSSAAIPVGCAVLEQNPADSTFGFGVVARIARSSSCATTTRRRTTSSRRRCKHGPTSRSCIAARRSSSTASVSRRSGGCSSRAAAAASGERRRYATVRTASCGTAGRVRLDCRRGRRELDGARLARLRHDDLAPHQQVRLVRHAKHLRYAHADVRREPARRSMPTITGTRAR